MGSFLCFDGMRSFHDDDDVSEEKHREHDRNSWNDGSVRKDSHTFPPTRNIWSILMKFTGGFTEGSRSQQSKTPESKICRSL